MSEPSRSTAEKDRLSRIERDMYYGNGLPGITTRLAQLETWKKNQEEAMEKFEGSLKGIKSMFWAIVLLLITTLATLIGTLLTRPHL